MSSRFCALPLACVIISAVISDGISASTIGLYVDQGGSTCSFAGNNPGILTAYVVVKADAAGVRSVQFAAPVPLCLGAVHLYDAAGGNTILGNTQTGAAVIFPFCAIEGQPAVALEVTFFRNGSTTPCCAYPITADPSLALIEGSDCSSQPVVLEPVMSHFNAGTTCPCADALPPDPPSNPNPVHQQTDVSMTTTLEWSVGPTALSMDLYLGTDPNPPFLVTVTEPQYEPPLPLNELTDYYWRVVARDFDGQETSGPTWRFVTRPTNYSPNPPVLVAPNNGATLVPVSSSLLWQSFDADFDALSYDVYFGTAADPPLTATALTETVYSLGVLDYSTTYRWKIVVNDSFGNSTPGPVWSFTTRPFNLPPSSPVSPFSGALDDPFNNVVLTWESTDPDGDPLTYDVYFAPSVHGVTDPPPLIASNLTSPSYGPLNLSPSQFYHLRIVAKDNRGAQTSGPMWVFSTKWNGRPEVYQQQPANFATVHRDVHLWWKSKDADDDQIFYDVYFGTQPTTLTKIASAITTTTFDPGPLQNGPYYWSITFWDVHGNGMVEPKFNTGTWRFTVSSTATGTGELPLDLTLATPYPNPFNPQTRVRYTVPKGPKLHVRMTVYDAIGRPVRTLVYDYREAGAYEVEWRGDDDSGGPVASGVYYCVLNAGEKRLTQKMVLLK